MSFNPNDTYIRTCICEEEDPVDTPKSFCYVEGTKQDKNTSDNISELSENVWYEAKPPKLFKHDIKPLIPARQIQISRIIMSGGSAMQAAEDEGPPVMEEKVIVGIDKKKSAVRFLSTTKVQD